MGSRSAKAWVSLSPRQRLSGPACPPAQRSLQCQPTTSDLLQPEHLHLQPEDAPGPRGGTWPECGQQTCLEASTPGRDLSQGETSARGPPPAPSGRTAPTLRCVPCGPPGGALPRGHQRTGPPLRLASTPHRASCTGKTCIASFSLRGAPKPEASYML